LTLGIMPAAALDPRDLDILRIRLGMGETAVSAHLAEQGITSVQRQANRACPVDAIAWCRTVIVARTRDGSLTIELADPMPGAVLTEPWVSSILYRLDGRGPNESEMIRMSVLGRFGQPSSLRPMTWCEQPDPTGACPANRPHLVFEPGPDIGARLFLTAGLVLSPPR
jgi:hypothetical protein